MNIAQLLWKMWQLRLTKPERFSFYHIRFGNKVHSIYYRRAIIMTTICAQDMVENDIREQPLEVVYSDQNPFGKSREAEMVREGLYSPHQIGWLYITRFNERRLWLGKIVGGRPTPFIKGEYDPKTKELNLSL